MWIVQGTIGARKPATSSAAAAAPGRQPRSRATPISAASAKREPDQQVLGPDQRREAEQDSGQKPGPGAPALARPEEREHRGAEG